MKNLFTFVILIILPCISYTADVDNDSSDRNIDENNLRDSIRNYNKNYMDNLHLLRDNLQLQYEEQRSKRISCQKDHKPDCPPRKKFISSATSEPEYAAYMKAWQSKIEKVGRQNYQILLNDYKHNNTASAIIDCAINTDGTINQVTVRKSSGDKSLDQAIVEIIKLSAPFEPLPESIKNDVDILHITSGYQIK